MMSSPLVGAWELVSDTHQGVMVCSETHYSFTISSKNRQRIEEPATDDMVESYRDVNANVGTYTVSGAKLTFHRDGTLRINLIEVPAVAEFTAEFTIEGDRLSWRLISGTTRPREDVWRKVG